MKKRLRYALCMLILAMGIQAQVANYTFSSSTGVYTPITGGTVQISGTFDNSVSGAITIPSFTYNGTAYTQVYVSANGLITFGSAPASANYTPISATAAYAGAISAMGVDLQNAAAGTPEVRYAIIGNEFVAQWQDVRRYGHAGEQISFQIRLNTTTNAITIIYGGTITSGATVYGREIGLRGSSNAFANNTNSIMIDDVPAGTNCNWANVVTANANNSTMYFSSANAAIAPANGLTFTWAPPVAPVAPVRAFGAVAAITLNSADLSWTAASGATQYNVQYRIPGTCAWTNFSGNPVMTNSVSLTGLVPSTVYQVRVQSSNGTNASIWSHIPDVAGTGNGYSATGTLKTLSPPCAAPTAQPTNLVFNAVASTSVGATFSAASPTVTNYLVVRTLGTAPNTPTNGVTYPTGASAALNGTVVSVGTGTTITSTGLAGNTNYTYFVYAYNSGTCSPVYLGTSPLTGTVTTCPATPGTGTVSAITQNAFNLSWGSSVGGGASPVTYTVDIATDNAFASPIAGSPFVVTAPTSSLAVSGLASSTAYFYRIMAGNGCNSAYTATASVATVCTATNVPYVQDFESVTIPALPICTSAQNVGSGNIWNTASPAAYGFNNKNLMYSYSSTNPANTWFYTQGLNLTAGQSYRLTYRYGCGDSGYPERMRVCYGTSAVNTAMTTTLATHASIVNDVTPITNTLDFIPSATGVYYLGFQAYSATDQFRLLVDDITVNLTPTCFPPTAVTVFGTTAAAASFSWTAPATGTPASYIYEVRTGGAAGSGTTGLVTTGTVTVPTTSVNVTGLTATTAYSVYVRSDCGGGDLSAWSPAKNFTTTATCPAPTTPVMSNVNGYSAVATWTAGASETAWDLYYGPSPLTAPTATTVPTATVSGTPSYTLSSLTPTTGYAVYVRANCGAANTSTWSAVRNFTTTVSCPAPTSLTLTAVTPTTAVATWTTPGTETSWLLNYAAPTTTVVVSGAPSYTITGLTPSTSYSVQVKGICGAGDSSAWTTVRVFMTPCLPPNITGTTPGSRCGIGTMTLGATADPGATLQWYTASNGGTAVGTGSVFTTPTISTTTSYYVAASTGGGSTAVGPLSPAGVGGTISSSSLGNRYMMFDVLQNTTLVSLDIFPTAAIGSVGSVSVTTSADVLVGNVSYTTTVTGGNKQTISMNLPLAVGTGYKMRQGTAIALNRNESGAVYPYNSSAVKITGNDFDPLYYYFYYNWQLTTGCESVRALVTASVTTPPTLSVSPSATVCANAISTVSISSTTSNYDSYVWAPVTNLYTDAAATTAYTGGTATVLYYRSATTASAVYTVNATNSGSGCANVATTTLTTFVPTFTASLTPTLVCSGAAVTLSATAGANTGNYTWQWNPGALSGNTVTANPVNTGTTGANVSYTVTATHPATSCTGTAVVSVSVNPVPVAPVAHHSTQCGFGVPSASVTGIGGTYKWYAASTGTTVLQSGSVATYTTAVGTSTTFYVSESFGSCEGPRAAVNVTVTAPDALTASVSSSVICPNAAVTLSVTKTGSANTYTYSWTASPVAGSGIPTSVSGSTAMITPTSPGLYTYTVIGSDAGSGCNAITTVTLNVIAPPATPTISPSTPSLCIGSTVTLTALGATNASSLIAENFEGGTLGSFSVVNLANHTAGTGTQWAIRTSPYNGWTGATAINSGSPKFVSTNADVGSSGSQNNSSLVSSVVNTTGMTGLSLNFNHFYDYHNYRAPDSCYVEVSTNGTVWTAVKTYTADVATSASFASESIPLNSYVNQATLQIRFRFRSGWNYGWCLDDIALVGTQSMASITYSWVPGTGLSATTGTMVTANPTTTTVYTVTADNGSCTSSSVFTLNVNPVPSVSVAASTGSICSGTTASLTATGAATYNWMPAGGTSSVAVVSPAATTVYTVTGTSLGCSTTQTVNLNVTPTPTVAASASPSVICAGATVSLTASGAATYNWMPNSSTSGTTTATPTVSTTYTVSGTTAGCTNTRTLNVTVNNVPTLTVTANPASGVLCTTGATATLTAAGTSTAYVWGHGPTTASTSVAPSATTVYSVTGTNSCGAKTVTASITVATTPTIAATSSSTLICVNNSAVLTASATAGVTYSWSTGSSATSVTVSPNTTTTYTVTGSNACGTATATVVQSVSQCIGIEEVVNAGEISIYPNPANEHVSITVPAHIASANAKLEVTDALGKLVMTEAIHTEITTLRLTELKDGVYFFRVITNGQPVKVTKVVKQ